MQKYQMEAKPYQREVGIATTEHRSAFIPSRIFLLMSPDNVAKVIVMKNDTMNTTSFVIYLMLTSFPGRV